LHWHRTLIPAPTTPPERTNGTSSATGNTATADDNADNANNPAAYQQIGRGKYDGMATPIPAQKGQANANSNAQNRRCAIP
jgi:hypothetical protein